MKKEWEFALVKKMGKDRANLQSKGKDVRKGLPVVVQEELSKIHVKTEKPSFLGRKGLEGAGCVWNTLGRQH